MLKNYYHGEGYCVCCLNYKGKEVEGCELKLNRLTADNHYNTHIFKKKKKKKKMKPFYLLYFGQNSFSILMLLKTGVVVYI